jgi:acyl dehydratase
MAKAPKSLTGLPHQITQEQLNRYAHASGDHNPLHLDADFAANTPYGKPIAHGMLVLAVLSEMLTRKFGATTLRGARLRVRFRAPVFPGDTVNAKGTLRPTASPSGEAVYDVECRNQDGKTVITGEAALPWS